MKIKTFGSKRNPGKIIDLDNTPEVKQTISAITPEKIRGFGDIIHLAVQPIAKTIDKAMGTNIQGCNSCAKRREILNKLLPL